MISSNMLWAKLHRQGGSLAGWHSLVDHSADVAAVMAALLEQPTIRRRLAAAAGLPDLDPVVCARLGALAFLHDIGKANRGFRARIDPKAPPVGHINELSWLFHDGRHSTPLMRKLYDLLGLERIEDWFGDDLWSMLEAAFAHHGRPWLRSSEDNFAAVAPLAYWQAGNDGDPIADLAPMREHLDRWFADALASAPPAPAPPLFQHLFAGLLMMADWLGSDEHFFPFANGGNGDRYAWALARAREALACVGLSVEGHRRGLAARSPGFEVAFGFKTPRPIQEAVAQVPGRLAVLEAETGSGKTEAALWRFKQLFEAGEVDGLYFALPTRVAATQIFERVKRFRDGIFPDGDNRPGVVLAVPGQSRFDEAEAKPLPDFKVQWSDDRGINGERWAAERPKRFLAATIAVGTVDQALLGAVKVKHAHLRAAALSRHLLVVDEVHASDVYAGALLEKLLAAHTAAGGHAMLLSATLGSGLRAKLLGAAAPPNLPSAVAAPYPALSWAEQGMEVRLSVATDGSTKAVRIEPAPLMQDAAAIAAEALAAARGGAAVLVIRNTVAAAVATGRALEEIAGPDDPALFRLNGVATLHHSRFALEDRRLLDAAVEAQMGKQRASGRGLIVLGSQTLEISLDLDADLLITDLAPVDVLLQRIGRLHRHGRARPEGFREPRAILLTPADRDLLATRLTGYGLGPLKDGHGIYPDLRILEATWRLADAHPLWTIPDMNRLLVEGATHREVIASIEADNPRLREGGDRQAGIQAGQVGQAALAHLDRTEPFSKCIIPRDEKFATRLGGDDRLVLFDPPRPGPFGASVTTLKIPGFLARGIEPEAVPAGVVENEGALTFRLGEAVFSYGRFGLLREN